MANQKRTWKSYVALMIYLVALTPLVPFLLLSALGAGLGWLADGLDRLDDRTCNSRIGRWIERVVAALATRLRNWSRPRDL